VSGGHDDRGAEDASIEAPKAPSEVGYGEGCPLPSRLGGLGGVVSSPSGVRGGAPAAIAFSALLTVGTACRDVSLQSQRCA